MQPKVTGGVYLHYAEMVEVLAIMLIDIFGRFGGGWITAS
jgi:hypothetical protein